jgi:polyisoprenoid-binding protein YceI
MRFVLTVLSALALTAAAAAQASEWEIDPNHTAAQFSVRHLGVSTVRGAFMKVKGWATVDPHNPDKGGLDATIEAASVDTRVEMRDNDLRSPNFLDVQKFPTITFHSKATKSVGAGHLEILGDLTIHGVTKEVTLKVEGPSEPIKDPWGNPRIGASATTVINRHDFGVNGAPGVVGDDITITIDAELIQPQGRPVNKK